MRLCETYAEERGKKEGGGGKKMRPGYVAYAYVRQMRSEVLCQT